MSEQSKFPFENDGQDSTSAAPQNAIYEQEIAPARSGRFSATTLVTTGLLIAGGLVGGAAFAITTTGQQASVAPAVVDGGSTQVAPAVVDSATATPTPSATSTDSATAAPSVSGGKTISIPPAAFDEQDGQRDFHPAPAAGSTAAPTTGAAPTFGGGSDDNGEYQGSHSKPPRDGKLPHPARTGVPTFNTNSDDSGQND